MYQYLDFFALNEGRDRSPGDTMVPLSIKAISVVPLNEGRDRSPGDTAFVVYWARSEGRNRWRGADGSYSIGTGGCWEGCGPVRDWVVKDHWGFAGNAGLVDWPSLRWLYGPGVAVPWSSD